MNAIKLYFILTASSLGYVIAGSFLARYADSGSLRYLAASFCFFAVCNLLYARIIAYSGFGSAHVISSAGTMIATVIVAAAFFGENLTPAKCLGLLAALIAMACFALPTVEARS